MLKFYNTSLFEIQEILTLELKKLQSNDILEFEVLNPDIKSKQYNGYNVQIDNDMYIHRSYKTWIDLSELLFCNMLSPKINKHIVTIRFEKLQSSKSFHNSENNNEKYGVNSEFFNINKNEEISFMYYYKQALQNINIDKKIKILNIGINKADEFELIQKIVNDDPNISYTGIDYSSSAIHYAKNRFKANNFEFIQADVNKMDELNLGKFDLIISIGTLQSSSINFKPFLASLIQQYLTNDGSIILGFPNCRWIDGSMIYGAKVKNYSFSEMSLLYKDVHYCKKYLQQKKFKVIISGKDYVFLSANKI